MPTGRSLELALTTSIKRHMAPLLLPTLMDMAEAKRNCRSATLLTPSFLFLALLLCGVWPLPMASATQDMKSIYAGPRVVPVRLGRPAFGPESLAFDHRGGGPYTGVSNGRVLRWNGRTGWTEFAHNYKHE